MAALLRERFGLSVTPGGLVHVLHRAARVGRPDLRAGALCEQIRGSPVVSPDETGWRRVGAVRHWLWAFGDPGDHGVSDLPGAWLRRGGRGAGGGLRRCPVRDGWDAALSLHRSAACRRVWRTCYVGHARCPRIIRTVRGRPACRRSSPTPSRTAGRRAAHALTITASAVPPAGACSRALGRSSTRRPPCRP